MKEKHFMNDLSNNILLAVSESSYTNDLLSFEWLKHFNNQTEEKANGEPRLFVMDGHGSHLTDEFINLCWDCNIIPFLLPPHSTHLLQPLDIGVFQSFKHYHQEILEESIRFSSIEFKRKDFLASFQTMRNLTFKKPIILRAWKLASLIPFNQNHVLKQMEVMSTPERELEPIISIKEDFSLCQTLRNLIACEKYSSYINSRLASVIDNSLELSPTVARVIEKRDKGTKILLLSGILAREELDSKKDAELEKLRRKQGNRKVQQYGTILVGDARLKVIARDEAAERRIELYNERKEEIELERRAIDDRKAERVRIRKAKQVAKDERMADRIKRSKEKQDGIDSRRAARAAKAATRLALSQSD